jgi:TRAP-type C4-dicarboxylate transport system permease small subunit
MEVAIHKLSAGAMVMALLMLLFGSFMFVVGYVGLSEWRSERAALLACNIMWILSGPVVFGSALWLFGSLEAAIRWPSKSEERRLWDPVQSWSRPRRPVCCNARARLECAKN